VVYWYVLEVAHIRDGIMALVMALWVTGLGTIGGLVGYGIQRLKSKTLHLWAHRSDKPDFSQDNSYGDMAVWKSS